MLVNSPPQKTHRRATVLVMVIGVLAMLFIVGSTLLVVSRFEKQTVQQKLDAKLRGDNTDSLLDSVLLSLRKKYVGNDGEPYNAGWNTTGVLTNGDSYIGEKYASFGGYLPDPDITKSDSALSAAQKLTRVQNRLRGGSLLISSNEPYLDDAGGIYRYASLASDQLFALPGSSPPPAMWRSFLFNSFLQPGLDADGDGVPDSGRDTDGDGTIESPLIDGEFKKSLRIVSNGGKVLLDPLTHPALLVQVIHPKDLANYNFNTWADLRDAFDPTTTAGRYKFRVTPSEDEPRLRRRGGLPDNASPATFDTLDLRSALKYTMGFEGNTPYTAANGWAPHYEQVTTSQEKRNGYTEQDWWKAHALPTLARTDPAYDKDTDNYDRRHLLTTVSNDDILRPRRDEKRLDTIKDPNSNATLLDYISPAAAPNASWAAFTNLVMSLQYGRLPEYDSSAANPLITPIFPRGTDLFFNNPGVRTQFSLRDVLTETYFVGGASPKEYQLAQPSVRRLIQLTAYYFALMQHTSQPFSDYKLDPNDATQRSYLQDQLTAAAQLAVNTVDFADVGPAVDPKTGTFLSKEDLPTRFTWELLPAAGPVPPLKLDVTGVERHPYITEAYCRIIQRPQEDPAPGSGILKKDANGQYVWNEYKADLSDAEFVLYNNESIYAVELYNPYDVPLNLADYSIASGTNLVPIGQGSDLWLPPYNYAVVANRYSTGPVWLTNTVIPVNAVAPASPADQPANVIERSALLFASGQPITLIRNDVLEVSSTWNNATPPAVLVITRQVKTGANVVVDIIQPAGLDQDVTKEPKPEDMLSARPLTWARPRMAMAGDKLGENKYVDDPTNTTGGPTDPVDLPTTTVSSSTIHYDIRRPGVTIDGQPAPLATQVKDDRLIRDYTLQRHKEIIIAPVPPATSPTVRPPLYWHTTLSRQIMFPSYSEYMYDSADPKHFGLETDTLLSSSHHNLLGYNTSGNTVRPYDPQLDKVDREFKGLSVDSAAIGTAAPTFVGFFPEKTAAIAGFPVVLNRALPETPHPTKPNTSQSWTINLQYPATQVVLVFEGQPGPPTTSFSVQDNGDSTNGMSIGAATPATLGTDSLYVVGGNRPFASISLTYAATTADFGIRVKQILDASASVPLTIPTAAFPTTNSLLLVTRYATVNGTSAPGFAAASAPPGSTRLAVKTVKSPANAGLGYLQQLDLGHFPVWDSEQATSDGSYLDPTDNRYKAVSATLDIPTAWRDPQGANVNTPWGQLITNYFTALPLEELVVYRDLTTFGGINGQRLIDLDAAKYNKAYSTYFPLLPVVEPVQRSGNTLVGPRVRGRINVNAAPWWVLDGLPLLNWDSVPVTEALWYDGPYGDRMDLPNGGNYANQPSLKMLTDAADENDDRQSILNLNYAWKSASGRAPYNLTTVSPSLARAMVAYREMRNPYADAPANTYLTFGKNTDYDETPTAPGFVSLAQMADVAARQNLKLTTASATITTPILSYGADPSKQIPGIRERIEGTDKPYSYLNYLQLVTTAVRLEDWATVKDHVYSVYMTQGDMTADPAVWTHAELTVDCTRCLYSNDLPDRVSETAPISYYNVISDQK